MSLVEANGTTLYYEVRGQGPPFLMIPGTPGYSAHYVPVAELLADEFTVVTYDRRGNTRSPRPQGWVRTSVREQADDAAALVESLELAPAAAFGLSSGGVLGTARPARHGQGSGQGSGQGLEATGKGAGGTGSALARHSAHLPVV